MRRKTLAILSLGLVLIVILSGCISTEPWPYYPGGAKKYSGVSARMIVNQTEVEEMNITEITPKLNDAGFEVHNNTPGEEAPGFTLRNWSHDRRYNFPPELTIFIGISDFDILYCPTNSINSSRDDITEQNNITTYIRMRANGVATICNITLDWNVANWTWNVEP